MLILVGCNHRSAPVAFRERLAFTPGEIPRAIDALRESGQIDEAVILSTCNRVEVLVRVDDSDSAVEAVKGLLGAARDVSREQIDQYTYHFIGRDAVRHLFRVGAGLDSMILGEPQILGQVKHAYLVAKGHGATGPVLDRLLQQGLAAAKRIRTETGISRNAVSVASAAVNLAQQIFGDLAGRKALLIGSGKMPRLVAKHLVSHGVTEVWVTSRTYDHALTLAEHCGGTAVHWDDGFSRLSAVDVVVSCTGSPRPILSRKTVVDALYKRRGEPLFIIDIAVPRDVDPDVNRLDNVYVYDIDGLQGVVDANQQDRRRASEVAQNMIDREVEAFGRWLQSLEITPTIVSLRERLSGMAGREIERWRRRLGPLSAEQQRAIEALVRSVVQKILHRPVQHLRRSVDRGDVDSSAALYREIFGLDESGIAGGERADVEEGAVPDEKPEAGPRRLLRGGKDD